MRDSEKSKANHILKAYASCRDGLIRSIMKMCVRQQDVDDILQETLVRVLHANRKTRISSPQDYLFVVSRHLVFKRLSLLSREISMEINDALLGIDEISADRSVHDRRKFELFNHALSALPEKKRRAILLRKFYGLSHREIAKKMKVSVSSVEKYIASGVNQCKRILDSQGYDLENHVDDQKKTPPQYTKNSSSKEIDYE